MTNLGRVTVAFSVLALVFAVGARGELSQNGDLFIRFDGGLAPRKLPRDVLAPIGVRIEGTIRMLSRRDPPVLRRIRIALNRGGRLSTRGLPVCRRDQIDPATPAKALAVCGRSLVGSGGFTIRTTIDNQAPTTSPGEILLFNTKEEGHNAILAHLYQTEPAPVTSFIRFGIHHSRGRFGTVLDGTLESNLARNAYLKTIYLRLERTYRRAGRTRSYLSASCPGPKGVQVVAFPFAHASMTFDDGRTLSSTLIRTCHPE